MRTGSAGAAESGVAQSAVGDRGGGDAGAGFCQARCSTGAADVPGAHSLQSATGAGAMPVPGRAHWGMRERCTFLGGFAPRAPISPGRSFLKVQICPNQCTHPAHTPSSDAQPYKKPANLPPTPLIPQVTLPQNSNLPIFCTLPTKNKHQRGRVRPPSNGLQLIDLNHSTRPTHQPQQAPPHKPFSVQKPGRFAPQPPVSPAHATQKPKSADFLYFPHQKQTPTGQSAPFPPPRHRSPPRLIATAEQSANYRLSGNSTVTRHPSPSLRTLTVP